MGTEHRLPVNGIEYLARERQDRLLREADQDRLARASRDHGRGASQRMQGRLARWIATTHQHEGIAS